MFCPKCRGEYVEGVKRCPNCEVDLIEALEPEPKEEFDYAEYVTVYSTADPAIIALAESLLDADNIRYSIKSEGLQTILGLGIVQFQVAEADKEVAYELLKDLIESGDEIKQD